MELILKLFNQIAHQRKKIVFESHGGNVGIGTTSPGAKLEVKGYVCKWFNFIHGYATDI